jgi:hypothetical protein
VLHGWRCDADGRLSVRLGRIQPNVGQLLAYRDHGGLAFVVGIPTFGGEDCAPEIEAMSYSDPMFWFTSVGLPAIIIVGGWLAVYMHERSLKR